MISENPPHPPARRGRKPKPRLLQLRIALARIEPPIWRRVRVPDAYTLHQLHRVIQMAFGWLDYHLYSFRIGERRFEAPHEEAEDEDTTVVRLRDLGLSDDARFRYTYDFGDNWVHVIEMEGVYIAAPIDGDAGLPVLYAGERAGPPEDCGGPHGYAEMLEALADPRHPEHGTYRLWAQDYDPEQFDVRTARNNLVLAAAWGAI
ncbi:MAG TPA: plasmid pRiA4b ORF-3 family protein [Longimicrobium sp.]|jgi:hypothetical protein